MWGVVLVIGVAAHGVLPSSSSTSSTRPPPHVSSAPEVSTKHECARAAHSTGDVPSKRRRTESQSSTWVVGSSRRWGCGL
eukprot:5187555-Prymnesium_polylepis.2